MSKAGNNSFKNKDYYKHYKVIKPVEKDFDIDYSLYVNILNSIFDNFFDVIIKEGSIDLPNRLGTLFLRRIETKPRIIEGKVRYVAPVDWYNTKKLWEEDTEAKANKTLVKFTPGEVYHIKYLSNFALHRKTKYYTFRLEDSIIMNMQETQNILKFIDMKVLLNRRQNGKRSMIKIYILIVKELNHCLLIHFLLHLFLD
jgi:hypothetical protein